MELILEGNITSKYSVRDALAAVLEQSHEATGILRISCPRKNLNGRIAIQSGRFVVGAQLSDTDISGWEAAKKLLSVTDGNFAFLASEGGQPIETGKILHLNLPALVEILPEVPESPAELFDEQSLLDDVFGPGSQPAGEISETPTTVLPVRPDDSEKAQASWQVVNTLMQDEGPQSQQLGPILGNGARALAPTKKTSALPGKARTKPSNPQPVPTRLIVIALLFLVVLIIWLLKPLISVQTGQRSFNGHGSKQGNQRNQ